MAQHEIRICLGSSCFARGNENCLEYIKQYLADNKLKDKVDFRGHLCAEKCKIGPNLKIDGVVYHDLTLEKLPEILEKHFA